VLGFLPLCFSNGPEEDVIPTIEIHDSVLELELPLVPGSTDLVVLANYNLQKNLKITKRLVENGFKGVGVVRSDEQLG
jgi:hypothetical protein